jgi:hypothetical protein
MNEWRDEIILHEGSACVILQVRASQTIETGTRPSDARAGFLDLCPAFDAVVTGRLVRLETAQILGSRILSSAIFRSEVNMRCHGEPLFFSALFILPLAAQAQTSRTPPPTQAQFAALQQAVQNAQSNADNAWMLVSAALVLLMTGPGLALFYGGLVRRKNILSTMMQSFAMMGLVTIL